MPYLIAVGACYLDTVLTVPYYPEEDEKLRATKIIRRRGGNCPNTLEVLQQLIDCITASQSSTYTLSPILSVVLPSAGSPAFEEIQASLGPNFDLAHCTFREEYNEPASSYIIKSDQTQSRTIVNYNALPENTPGELIKLVDKFGEKASWWHFEGRIPDVILECVKHLRARTYSVQISIEVEKPGREGLKGLAAEADVVFYSKNWAIGDGHRSAEDCLKAQVPFTKDSALLCCTWGVDGVTALSKPEGLIKHTPAFQVQDQEVVDTIGAGDTFVAGMLFSLHYHAKDWDLDQMLSFSAELAGRKVLQEGFQDLGAQVQHRIAPMRPLQIDG